MPPHAAASGRLRYKGVHIETLSSAYFRNLASKSISFSPGINLIVGENGQGKTNILEAIYVFKFGRSFRTGRDLDLICFGKDFCKIEVSCRFGDGGRERFSMTVAREGTKNVKISGKAVSTLTELVGRYPCVLFGPQDLQLVHGPPEERRRFTDIAGSMTDRSYLELLKSYRRVLQQRNAVLKRGGKKSERSAWDEELIAKGCALTEKRKMVVDTIENYVKHHHGALCVPFAFSMIYESSFMDERTESLDARDAFSMKLASVEDEEERRGITLVGPHRDEVRLYADGKNIKRFGSQGQKRLLAVLLKLSELSFLETELGETCVLLLDDVFSEFDEMIRSRLMELLVDERQVFVTSPTPLDWESARSIEMFHVSGGEITA